MYRENGVHNKKKKALGSENENSKKVYGGYEEDGV